MTNWLGEKCNLTREEFRKLPCPERSCDRVARGHLDKWVCSSLIGGGRFFSTLLSVMLFNAVLTNEVRISCSVSSLQR